MILRALVLWCLGTQLALASLPTHPGVLPAPATNVTVNGSAADRYSDLTFAKDGFALSSSNNTFGIIASNVYGGRATNNLTVNLPVTVIFQYDSNGNLTNDGTRSFLYDAENQLTNVFVANQWKTEFVYDGLGRRRISKDYAWQGTNWVKTNETRFLYDGMMVVQERDSNNVPQLTYTRGLDLSGGLQGAGGIGGLLAMTLPSTINSPPSNYFYHADGAGNITTLIDAQQNIVARYEYDAYGRLIGKWGARADANRYRFSSKEVHPNSGLYYYGFRFYDPTLQRWINTDPIGEAGGINLYGFAGNGPINFIDPLGLDWFDDFGFWELDVLQSIKEFFVGKPGWEYNIKNRNITHAGSGLITPYTDEFGNDITKDLVLEIGTAPLMAVLGGPEREGIEIFGSAAKCRKVANVAAEDAKLAKLGACFVSGTEVAAENGPRPIEDIKVGDRVWAWDEKTGEVALKEVRNTMNHIDQDLILVELVGISIEVTSEHPFWVEGVGWTGAQHLKPDDEVRTLDGARRVTFVERHETQARVFNLEVAEFHTYFVSACQVLVHNQGKSILGNPLAAEETAALRPYGGPGGGHHLPAKSAFEGAAGYDLNEVLAIPNAELARLGVNHSLISGAQQTLYRAFAESGASLTWETMETIETQAHVRGGMKLEMAQPTAAKAIEALKAAGVPGPTRIPWGN